MKDYFILKNACRAIYLAGGGDFWYEKGVVGYNSSILYNIYGTTLYALFIIMTILELCVIVAGEFPDDERGDAETFAISHTIVLCKMCSVMINKKLVKELLRDLVDVCSEHEDVKRMAAKARIIKINVIGNYFLVYSTAFFFVFEGVRKLLAGQHFVTIVTFWPPYDNDTALAHTFRIFWTFVLYVMMVPMIGFDCLVVTVLIILKYKFITLRDYFDKLKEEFVMIEKNVNRERAKENLWRKIVAGVVMHQKLLRIYKNIDKLFSPLITMQVCMGIASDVSLLLQLALIPNLSFFSQSKMVFFIICLLFLLAMFLCNAGEITYQASLLSDSVFYSGWELGIEGDKGGKGGKGAKGPRLDLGRLVLFTCTVAQKPLVMKAFGMLNMTYGTFLTVVRSMYSIFALILSKNKTD